MRCHMPFTKNTIYMKLYEQFKTMINENKYLEHDKLPSKRKLAASLKISPLTVQAAYEQLVAEGYVYAIEKSGYYVSKKVDVIQQITPKKKISFEESEKPFIYEYEFKTNIIDTNLFPSATWAKLTREVLAENHHETLNVIDPQGILKLREEITRYIEVYRGIHVDPNQIVMGSGGSQLMHIILDLLGRKQHYAIENPNYLKIYHIFKASEVKLSLISLDQSGLIVDQLSSSQANIVHVTPSHQFPTGVVMPIQRRNELLNWANQKEDRYIIEDDYDSEFRYQGSPIPALQSLDSNDKVIYINTFTKTLAPSFRMAYMVLPKKLLSKYQLLSTYQGCTVPNIEQWIMYRFMHGGFFERHINRMRNHYKKKLDIISEVISNYKDVFMIGEEAGLHFLLEIRRDIDEKVLIEQARQMKIEVTGIHHYNQLVNQKISNYPTLVIGYAGIPIEDIRFVMERLLSSMTIHLKDKQSGNT